MQQYLPFTVLKLSLLAQYMRDLMLQQYLPFTVLKLIETDAVVEFHGMLQQYLPFTVLKPSSVMLEDAIYLQCCNSTYRLRY